MGHKHSTRAEGSNQDKTSCDWKSCSGNPHAIKPQYPDRKYGCPDKKPIKNDIHPSLYNKWGRKDGMAYIPYRTTKQGKGIFFHNYRFQRHHVIPGNMKKKVPDLFHNLVLMGWDLNSPNFNCLNLPWYDKDIVWHDLQPHRGSHPKYDSEVLNLLFQLEQDCLEFCKNSEAGDKNLETTESLITLIDGIVSLLIEYLLNWETDWILLSTSPAKRKDVFRDLSDEGRLPSYPWRTFP